jgi:HK97 family phage portal protein
VKLFRRNRDDFQAMDDAKALQVKGVGIEWSESHADNWATNSVTIRTVTSTSSLYGGYSDYGLMYRRQPSVRSCVDFLSKNIGSLNPKVYERVGDSDRVDVTQHPLAVLLRNPNPGATQYDHLRDTVADLAIYDRAYWLKIRSGGRVIAVVRLFVSQVIIDGSKGYKRYLDPQGKEYNRRDLVVFAGYSPCPGEDGVSPLETLRQVLLEESASVAHREGMWNNAARQAGVIERPLDAPEWSDIARSRFREDWQNTYAGARNVGKTAILEEGMKWNAASFSPEQTQYIEARELTREEVALTYFGPVAGKSFLEASGTGTEATHRQVYQDVLGPWLEFIQGEIELQLLPEFEPLTTPGTIYVEFNLAAKLKGSFQEQAEALTTSVGVPFMAVDEARARLNLPAIGEDWAQQPVQPLNVMYGGQPAVTIPVTDTGTASAPDPHTKDLERLVADNAAAFCKHFDRMEKAVTSAGGHVDLERWNRELTADLYLKGTQALRDPTANPALLECAVSHAEAVNQGIVTAIADSPDDLKSVFDRARGHADTVGHVWADRLVTIAAKEQT